MPDIELYTDKPGLYNHLQHSRPDYSGTIDTVIKLGAKELSGKTGPVIADFCCGTGSITKSIAEKLGGIKKAILIDINKDFLKIAEESNIKAENIEVQCSDIVDARLNNESDLVLSIFAYHHLRDELKQKYVSQIKSALKPGGILILGEIYMPDKATTIQYYKHLYETIPAQDQNLDLYKFLIQTAESDDFEFKVTKDFADAQLKANGFAMIESKKIWPLDSSFPPEIGTFVEIWRLDR